MRLDHCCLNVRDMDRSIDFYTRHFGMTLLSRRDVPSSNAEIAFVGFGEDGMKLELTHWRAWRIEEYAEGGNFDHVALVLDSEDLRALVEDLRSRGVRVAREPFEMGGSGSTIAFVHDPDGNWVELVQRRTR